MRRIPYIVVNDNKLMYVCPKCRKVIPRDLYKLQDLCPSCNLELNKTAKSIMRVYKLVDEDFYKHFILISRR